MIQQYIDEFVNNFHEVWIGLGLYFANCFANKFGGYFEEKNVLRNMRNIVPNRAKFISFWAPERNSREMWLHRAKFSYGGVEIFLRGVGHVPLAVPVLLHSHPFSALTHTNSLYGSHFSICHTQLYVSRCRKIYEINNKIWVFLERNTNRNLVHFKRNTGQGQSMEYVRSTVLLRK
jgi:hypothetical protein